MKNKLITLGVIISIIGYYILSAWSLYSWSDRYLQSKGDSWLIFSKQDNAASLIHFYTIFNTPVTRIGLIEKSSLVKRPDSSFYIKQVWADKDIDSGNITEEAFQYLLDCDNKREGWLKNKSRNVTDPFIDDHVIEWSSFDAYEKEYPGAAKSKNEECNIINQYWRSK